MEPTKPTTFFGIGIGIICFVTIGASLRPSLGASEGGSGKVQVTSCLQEGRDRGVHLTDKGFRRVREVDSSPAEPGQVRKGVGKRERERMKEVWERLKKEQTALMEARDGLSKLMTKGTTDIWRMKSKMAEQLREYEGRIASAAAENDQSRKVRERKAKEREEVMKTERSQSMGCQGCNRQGCRATASRAMGPSGPAARATPVTGVRSGHIRPIGAVGREPSSRMDVRNSNTKLSNSHLVIHDTCRRNVIAQAQ